MTDKIQKALEGKSELSMSEIMSLEGYTMR